MEKMKNEKHLEKCSSAVTLSDMEVFIFPELMYSLVLANIMSPRIWRWREDPWFAGLERMKPYRKITRLKQYIMDHYAFNLDLDTWGLTQKDVELARFRDFVDERTLEQSNALFGYEGDKYYFDIDIRRHFGLDKYEGDVIPYWKTETVEAMDAFQYKPGFDRGGGECVSLAALYAAALFVVAEVPLKDIYMMATPLHSQNFIDLGAGILTNNRRLVTKNMWFNGTALSSQARRALENERVTIVAHETGYVHTVYDEATIDRQAYDYFSRRLREFLIADIDEEILGNFLRQARDLQRCFQIRWQIRGVDRYIAAERVFAYEHGSPYLLTDNTRDKLMDEIDTEEFDRTPLPGRIVFNELEDFVRNNEVSLHSGQGMGHLAEQLSTECVQRETVLQALEQFCITRPRLPDPEKRQFKSAGQPLGINNDMDREEIIDRLQDIRSSNSTADMAFYAYRDLARCDAEPFLKASVERNPVVIEETGDMSVREIVDKLNEMPGESIYDEEYRLAQPDEVWNYGRGDGLEKAVAIANVLHQRKPNAQVRVQLAGGTAEVSGDGGSWSFDSAKNIKNCDWTVGRS